MQTGNSVSPRSEQGTFLPTPQSAEKAAYILARYDEGEMVGDIAKDLNISPQAAYKALLRYCSEDWKDSQAAKALTEYEQAKAELERIKTGSRDQVELACAREQLRAAQWELERLIVRLYGQRTHVTVENIGDLGERLRRSRERTITPDVVDAEIVQPQQTALITHGVGTQDPE